MGLAVTGLPPDNACAPAAARRSGGKSGPPCNRSQHRRDLGPVGPAGSVRLAQRNKQVGTRVNNAEGGSYLASRVKPDATIASMIALGVIHSKGRGLLEEVVFIHAAHYRAGRRHHVGITRELALRFFRRRRGKRDAVAPREC